MLRWCQYIYSKTYTLTIFLKRRTSILISSQQIIDNNHIKCPMRENPKPWKIALMNLLNPSLSTNLKGN